MQDTIFVVTPCRNAEKTINETINSVVSQAGDFIIRYHVQDAISTDETIIALDNWKRLLDDKKYPLACRGVEFTYASEADQGMYHGIQKGFDQLDLQSDCFMTWINSDDIFVPHAFATVNQVGKELPEVKWITGKQCHLKKNSIVLTFEGCFSQELIGRGYAENRFYNFIQQEGTFWRYSLFNVVGGLNTCLKYAGDFDLWARFAQIEPLWYYPVVFAYFRNRVGQISNNLTEYYQEIDSCFDLSNKKNDWVNFYQDMQDKGIITKIAFDFSENNFITLREDAMLSPPFYKQNRKIGLLSKLLNMLLQRPNKS